LFGVRHGELNRSEIVGKAPIIGGEGFWGNGDDVIGNEDNVISFADSDLLEPFSRVSLLKFEVLIFFLRLWASGLSIPGGQ